MNYDDFSPALPPKGTQVIHVVHGTGEVVSHDNYRDDVLNATVFTGRLGVVFSEHKLLANPAYFWPFELTTKEPA